MGDAEDDGNILEALAPVLRGRPLIAFNFHDMEVLPSCCRRLSHLPTTYCVWRWWELTLISFLFTMRS